MTMEPEMIVGLGFFIAGNLAWMYSMKMVRDMRRQLEMECKLRVCMMDTTKRIRSTSTMMVQAINNVLESIDTRDYDEYLLHAAHFNELREFCEAQIGEHDKTVQKIIEEG